MKITVICKTTEWQVERLKEAASNFKVDIEIRDISVPGIMPENLGDIVLWRSSSLGSGAARLEMMNLIDRKHVLINRCLAKIPRATEKSFQQKYLGERASTIKGIPTFMFLSVQQVRDAIAEGVLRYPFILKPNKGSKGEGVKLMKDSVDLESAETGTDQLVFQNFIRNSGDYRVFILGGRVLGVIKRTAQEGSFLNNISKGGQAEVVTDPKVLTKLRHIGTTVASIFQLTLCGVDVIYDKTTGEYLFLEVNTVPQWKGFQEATGIDVANEIVQYCLRISRRGKLSTCDLVSEEYLSQFHLLGEKKFHLLSRLYLWTGDKSFKDGLEKLKKGYIGESDEAFRKRLRSIFTHVPEHGIRMVAREARKVYFEKYPRLESSLGLLFKYLFVREIYDIDLRIHIRELISDEELLKIKKAIESDEDAMRILSTHAINYLYLLENYLGKEAAKTNSEKFLDVGSSYPSGSSELQIYFFTHCIIGASRFYSRDIDKNERIVFIKMLQAIEPIIREDFSSISLDNKFEFLVCTKLCRYASGLENAILSEADRSLAPNGNFLIDTWNTKAAPDERNDFIGAEHRNVLYMMSQKPYHPLAEIPSDDIH
ncbi:MAG: hypothetical protein WCL23_03285 [Candidatus Moraniibacteriota bacterium]